MSSHPTVVALDVGGAGDAWGRAGLTVADQACQLGAVTLRFEGHTGRAEGLRGWALTGGDCAPARPDVDGIPTRWLPRPSVPDPPVEHRLGAVAVDHVVVATPDVDRTLQLLTEIGMVARAEHSGGSEARPVRHVFFRHGEAIVELVGPTEPEDDGPAVLWGITLLVEDIDLAAEHLGGALSPVRDAVQPGRRIATVRPQADLGTQVALISR